MAKYFLGSVGTAEAFRMIDGEPRLAFVSKTLTDSGLNISTTKDDVRAGTGAPIQFSFYHDPSVEITLTDVLFDEAYVEAQLGTQFVTKGNVYKNASYKAAGSNMTFTFGASAEGEYQTKDELQALNMGCGKSKTIIWYSIDGGEWKVAKDELVNKVFTAPKEGKICLRYVANDDNARIAEITANMIPEELFLVITAPIFAGDACSASNGKKAGSITYEVPRFKLNGAQEFAMNMSSNQTMSLAGVALASEDGCDVNGSKLLRIIAVYDNGHWYDDVQNLIEDYEYISADEKPHVYAEHKNGTVNPVSNEDLYFQSASGDIVKGTDSYVWPSQGTVVKVYLADLEKVAKDASLVSPISTTENKAKFIALVKAQDTITIA